MKQNVRCLALVLSFCLLFSLLAGCGGSDGGSSVDVGTQVSDTSGNPSDSMSDGSSAGDITTSDVSSGDPSSKEQTTTSTQTSKPENTSTQASSQATTSNVSSPSTGTIPYITKGLVARYDFEDGTNIGKDVSGNGNHLSVWGTGGKTVGQVGNSMNNALGKAAKFDGGALLAAKSLADSKSPSKDFVDNLSGSYTITFFARNTLTATTSDEVHKTLVCNGYWDNPTSPNLEFAFTYKKDGSFDSFANYINYGAVMNGLYFRKFQWQVDNGSFYDYGKVDTKWYHYALVINADKSCIDLYIDGKLVKSNAPGQPLATQSEEVPFSIGGMAVPAESTPVRDLLVGEMDDVRVYNRALTVYEIGNIQRLKG